MTCNWRLKAATAGRANAGDVGLLASIGQLLRATNCQSREHRRSDQ